MKRLLTVFALIMLVGSVATADSGWWTECLDGELHMWAYRHEQPEGRLLGQMRPVLEGLGWAVNWAPGADTIVATRGNTELTMRVGSPVAVVDGNAALLPLAPRRSYGVIYVPLRWLAELSGAEVRHLGNIVVITPTEGKLLVVHLI